MQEPWKNHTGLSRPRVLPQLLPGPCGCSLYAHPHAPLCTSLAECSSHPHPTAQSHKRDCSLFVLPLPFAPFLTTVFSLQNRKREVSGNLSNIALLPALLLAGRAPVQRVSFGLLAWSWLLGDAGRGWVWGETPLCDKKSMCVCVIAVGSKRVSRVLGVSRIQLKAWEDQTLSDPVTPGRCRGNTMRESVILPSHVCPRLSAMPGTGLSMFLLFLSSPREDPHVFAGEKDGGVGGQRERALWGAEAAKL